jgi:MGT family glycosyltransferase
VPQLEILRRSALFITHGGMNSVSEALLDGVPVIVVPQVGDQYFVAQRVAALGAGVGLTPAQATPERLRALAAQVLGDGSFRDQAGRIGQSLRQAGGYQGAADEVAAFKARAGIAA